MQTRQCCHARDQSHRIAGKSGSFPTLSLEKTDMFCSAFESILQKLVQMMGACRLILLIRSTNARSRESSIPAPSTVTFDLRDTLQLFGRLHIKTVLSISDLNLEPSSEQQLVHDDSAGRGQLLNRLVLGSFGLPCLSVDNPHFLNPIFQLLVPRVTHHGHVHAVCFTQRLVGACCGLLVVLMAVHELLCVVARPRPSWSLRAALVQSRSHVHLSSILWIHVICSDCSALLHTAQIPAETVVA